MKAFSARFPRFYLKNIKENTGYTKVKVKTINPKIEPIVYDYSSLKLNAVKASYVDMHSFRYDYNPDLNSELKNSLLLNI